MKSLIGGDLTRHSILRIAYIITILTVCTTARGDVFPSCADLPQGKCSKEGSIAGQEIRCGIQNGIFLHGSRRGNQIALTFDLCPTNLLPAFAPEIVDYLERERVPTTFFVSGQWAESNPDEFRRIKQVPFFEIALHGYRHPRLVNTSAETIRAEIEDGKAALLGIGVTPTPLFRPPYWDQPPALSVTARQCGVLPVVGDVGLGDPDPHRTSDIMERDAIRWVQAGSVIVLHANGRGYATAETVRNLVPLFRQRGYIFARVSDLVAECRVPTTETQDIDMNPHMVYQ